MFWTFWRWAGVGWRWKSVVGQALDIFACGCFLDPNGSWHSGVGLALGGVGKVALARRWEILVHKCPHFGIFWDAILGVGRALEKVLEDVVRAVRGPRGVYTKNKNVHFGPPPGVGLALAAVEKVSLVSRWTSVILDIFYILALAWHSAPLEKCRWSAVGVALRTTTRQESIFK